MEFTNDFDRYMYEHRDEDLVVYDWMPWRVTDFTDCEIWDGSPIHMDEKEIKEREEEKIKQAREDVVISIEEAVQDFQIGCEEAFGYVYRYFKQKIEYMAFAKCEQKKDDLISELHEQLLKCMRTYKPGAVKFNTYFWRCAQNTVGMFFNRLNTKKRLNTYGELSLSAKIDNEQKIEIGDIIVDTKAEDEFKRVNFLRTVKDSLFKFIDKRDREIITLCINGNDVVEISSILEMSRAAIYQRLKRLTQNTKIRDKIMEFKQSLLMV